MPIFFETDLGADAKLAIWKIAEEEFFFLRRVPLQRSITHPHKRLQHLAGRYLLQHLYPGFPLDLIRIADTRKPYLEDEAFHFSVSHCGDYAAVIASRTKRVGIDIELLTPKVQRIRHKFVSPEEEDVLKEGGALMEAVSDDPDIAGLIQLWSCKEAIFKWYGKGEMDFREHMQAARVVPSGEKTFELSFRLKKSGEDLLHLHSRFFENLCLSYLIT